MEKEQVIGEKTSEISFLKVQLQALQNYITSLLVERDQHHQHQQLLTQ